jgi:hypothetical protein
MELAYLIYKSTPKDSLTEKDLVEIAEQSKDNNIDNDLTGLLIYGSNEFVQILEGPEQAIETLYTKLLADKRHSNVTLVNRGMLERRYFPTWSMGFRSVSADEIQRIDKTLTGNVPALVTGYVALEMIAGFMKRNG